MSLNQPSGQNRSVEVAATLDKLLAELPGLKVTTLKERNDSRNARLSKIYEYLPSQQLCEEVLREIASMLEVLRNAPAGDLEKLKVELATAERRIASTLKMMTENKGNADLLETLEKRLGNWEDQKTKINEAIADFDDSKVFILEGLVQEIGMLVKYFERKGKLIARFDGKLATEEKAREDIKKALLADDLTDEEDEKVQKDVELNNVRMGIISKYLEIIKVNNLREKVQTFGNKQTLTAADEPAPEVKAAAENNEIVADPIQNINVEPLSDSTVAQGEEQESQSTTVIEGLGAADFENMLEAGQMFKLAELEKEIAEHLPEMIVAFRNFLYLKKRRRDLRNARGANLKYNYTPEEERTIYHRVHWAEMDRFAINNKSRYTKGTWQALTLNKEKGSFQQIATEEFEELGLPAFLSPAVSKHEMAPGTYDYNVEQLKYFSEMLKNMADFIQLVENKLGTAKKGFFERRAKHEKMLKTAGENLFTLKEIYGDFEVIVEKLRKFVETPKQSPEEYNTEVLNISRNIDKEEADFAAAVNSLVVAKNKHSEVEAGMAEGKAKYSTAAGLLMADLDLMFTDVDGLSVADLKQLIKEIEEMLSPDPQEMINFKADKVPVAGIIDLDKVATDPQKFFNSLIRS